MRERRAAAVADGDLDRTRVDVPGDLQPFARQRVCVQYRVAQKFANDQDSIGDRVVEDSSRPQFIGECLARESYARRGTRQVDDARLPHLPDRPPRQSAARFSRAPHRFRCPNLLCRKPAGNEAMVTVPRQSQARERPGTTLCPASKGLRWTDRLLTLAWLYQIVIGRSPYEAGPSGRASRATADRRWGNDAGRRCAVVAAQSFGAPTAEFAVRGGAVTTARVQSAP